MTCELHLEVFEGPFDLLLHLIEKNQLDILDIPVAEITRQYLEYLEKMAELDMEIASSFLVMAANLLLLKSRMLVPAKKGEEVLEEELDERTGLVRDLLEYARFKQAAAALSGIGREEEKHFSRHNEEELYFQLFPENNPLDGKTLLDLQAAFESVLSKARLRPQVWEISREEITVSEKMTAIFQLLKNNSKGVSFVRIFCEDSTRIALVVTFLALLELMRMGVVRVRQSDSFEEIFLYPYCLENYQAV